MMRACVYAARHVSVTLSRNLQASLAIDTRNRKILPNTAQSILGQDHACLHVSMNINAGLQHLMPDITGIVFSSKLGEA